MRHQSGLFAILLAVVALGDAACLPIQGVPSGVIVHAHLESSAPGTILYQQLGTNPMVVGKHSRVGYVPTYTPICEAPCDVDVDVGPPLYVSGESVYPSKLFTLQDARGPVTIKVRPHSWMQPMLGTAFIAAGMPTVIGGGILALDGEVIGPPRSHGIAAGLSTMGVGLVAITLGAVLLGTSKSTVDIWHMPAPAPVLAPPAGWPSPDASDPEPPR